MTSINTSAPRRQRGIALIAAILVLLVVTILGMAMFRSYGLQQRLGGNTREKLGALAMAMAAQNFAEFSLTTNNGANALATTNCSGNKTIAPGNPSGLEFVCLNAIPSTVTQPDTWGASFTYQVPNVNTTAGTAGSYAQYPQFYVTYLGSPNGTNVPVIDQSGDIHVMYKVDAVGWGSTPQSVAVVESSFKVASTKSSIGPSTPKSTIIYKNFNLGTP